MLSATIHSVLTKKVTRQEVGGVLGLASSIGSLTRVVGPITGAALLDVLGTWAPGLLGALLAVWLLVYVWRYVARYFSAPAFSGIEGEHSRV